MNIPHIVEDVRGSGLLTGIKVKPPMGDVGNACIAEKLLTVGAADNVIRLLPPLNVTEEELSEAVRRLALAFARLPRRPDLALVEAGPCPPGISST